MPVSSDSAPYKARIERPKLESYQKIAEVFSFSNDTLGHSRSPAALCNTERDRNLFIFEVFNSNDELVAYFPFEERNVFGITILRCAFYELTLDFIDIQALPEYKEISTELFFEWVFSRKNCVLDIFMCSEKSILAEHALKDERLKVQCQGKYYFAKLPETFDEYLNSLSRSVRQDVRRILRKYDDAMTLEITRSKVLRDELLTAINDLMRLHEIVFGFESAMLPHRVELTKYLERAFSDNAVFFMRAKEISTGEIIATNLFAQSATTIGLIQNGRKTDPRYSKIGIWLMVKTIKWAINEKFQRFEFHFGDQEYKRRLSTSSNDAVSISYFSSPSTRHKYRIMQRLGRFFKNLQ